MNKTVLLFLCLIGFLMCNQNSFGAVLLAEVANDPAFSGDPEGEYVIVCNTGSTAVNIQNYSFTDNSGFANRVIITSASYSLLPLKCILVIRDEPDGVDVFSSTRYNCGANPPNQFENAGTWGNNFGNSAAGDQVYLFDSTATTLSDAIDSMSYGSNSIVFPANTLAVSGGSGRVFRRTNYPLNIAALGSPSTASDWTTFNPVVTQADYGSGISPCSIAPSAAESSISGRVTNAFGNGINRAEVIALNTTTLEEKRVTTNPFGYYQLTDLPSGDVYVVRAVHKSFIFQNQRTFSLLDNLENVDFISE